MGNRGIAETVYGCLSPGYFKLKYTGYIIDGISCPVYFVGTFCPEYFVLR